MLFNSLEFLVFASVILVAYYALGQWSQGHRSQNILLLIASYFFYAHWDWRFLSLIGLSTLVDYVVGNRLATTEDQRVRQRLLAISVIFNLGLLGVFKYYSFFATSLVDLLQAMSLPAHLPTLKLILPVGISFYTFQTMSYTIDIYRRQLEPTKSLLNFALFVAFFPQLVAGPIERARSLLPQIETSRPFDRERFFDGVYLAVWGMYKKVCIADVVSREVDRLFASSGGYSGLDIWLGLYLFAFQIYADFSGYTDIARGVSKMMGFDLRLNFNLPYFATNPSDFWRRWHISLSSWLREYLYFSLGGNRQGRLKTYRNLMLTMLLGGLWHGAAWTFVLWGAFHGLILVVHHYCRDRSRIETPDGWNGRRVLAIICMFHITCIGWLIFRAQSVEQVTEFASLMFSSWFTTVYTADMLRILLTSTWLLLIVQIAQLTRGNLSVVRHAGWFVRLNLYLLVGLALMDKFGAVENEFIYFQF